MPVKTEIVHLFLVSLIFLKYFQKNNSLNFFFFLNLLRLLYHFSIKVKHVIFLFLEESDLLSSTVNSTGGDGPGLPVKEDIYSSIRIVRLLVFGLQKPFLLTINNCYSIMSLYINVRG